MDEKRIDELGGILRKVQDNPDVLNPVNLAMDNMFSSIGFKLTSEEKRYVIGELIKFSEGKVDNIISACPGCQK